jgi:phage terminase large subunit GpA-like protein
MERSGQWHVPCPHCGALQVLRWGGPGEPFGIKWDTRNVAKDYEPGAGEVLHGETLHLPETAYYLCEVNGCRIEESSKPEMEQRGEYLAEDGRPVRLPGTRTVGYWLRGALSITLPGAEWPRLVREFLRVKDQPEAFKAFWNLVLGEFWQDSGEAPEWQRLYARRERYTMGVVQPGVVFLTAGVDVQKDRVEFCLWGWGYDKESWFTDHVVVGGDPYDQHTWPALTELLHRSWPGADGAEFPVSALAIDTGFAQEPVIDWARRTGDPRIMLVKGQGWTRVMLGSPTKSEVMIDGKRMGLLLWPVGTGLIKEETYGFLRLDPPVDGSPYPPGFVHLPRDLNDEQVKQLVAEDLVTKEDRRGYVMREWVKRRHRNEMLDGRVYARAAAEREGLSRLVRATEPAPKPKRIAGEEVHDPKQATGWLGRRGGRGRGGKGWIR